MSSSEIKYYTGVGSRETPEAITDIMSDLALALFGLDYHLRSGRAEGSDYAFQRGAEFGTLNDTHKLVKQDIYIPNERFNKCFGNLGAINPNKLDNYEEAEQLMWDIHPKGKHLRGFAREAHIRNMYQVLGNDLKTPSDFVLCYSVMERGRPTGGTASAYNLAKLYKIPVYNFYVESEKEEACQMILAMSKSS